MKKGFTLLEILLTIGILGVLFTMSFVALNTNRTIQEGNDTQIQADALSLYQALEQYAIANQAYPVDIVNMPTDSVSSICKSTALSCIGSVNLNLLVPTYIREIPNNSTDTIDSGFYIIKNSNNRIGIGGVKSLNNETFVKGLDEQAFVPTPSIVQDGLVLYLDAGNKASYPGTGTTWTDLSGNGNNATLFNGVNFDINNGGALVFDGIDDYARYSANLTESFSVITIARSVPALWNNYAGLGSSRNINGFILHNEINTSSVRHFVLNNVAGTTQLPGFFTPSRPITQNNMYTITSQPNSHRSYTNTTLSADLTSSIPRLASSNQPVELGRDFNIPSRSNNIIITAHLYYNRALSDTEVTRVYNAFKSRLDM